MSKSSRGIKCETTVVHCRSCKEAFRICGKDGTSIGYVYNCPGCGSEMVETKTEIMDLASEDADYYAEEVDLIGDNDG